MTANKSLERSGQRCLLELRSTPASSPRIYRPEMPNNTLERSCGHRGRAALAIDCVLALAEWAPCMAAQVSR